MIITLGQMNPTPRDFKGNLSQVSDIIESNSNSDLIVFPELTIPGYMCLDLVYSEKFIEKNLNALEEVKSISQKLTNAHIVIGYVDKSYKGTGKPFRNMAAVIHNGRIIATYQKRLLPFYDVHDEPRYFEPGQDLCVFEINGEKCGITICEDLWNDKGQDDYNYDDNPVGAYDDIGVDYLINLSSSPYARGKPERRFNMIRKIYDERNFKAIVYVNQYGGMDELVFDGCSIIYGCKNNICRFIQPDPNINEYSNYPRVASKTLTVDTEKKNEWQFLLRKDNMDEDEYHFTMARVGLFDYVKKCGFKNVVIGSSGGVDSAVVVALAASVFDPKDIHAITMPSKWNTDDAKSDAEKLHENLGINTYNVPIQHDSFLEDTNARLKLANTDYNHVADENIQARMRGNIIMHLANALNGIALTTGNKTELALGYCTLYGDMSGCFNPIGDLYKRQVYALGAYLNKFFGKEVIPASVFNKAPSAQLAPDQCDEESLMPYAVLDYIVKLYIENHVDSWTELCQELNGKVEKEILDKAQEKYYDMIRRMDLMEFKRRQATICTRLTPRAFGIGRRMPIVKGG
jgi:NAD+ synthase (glutamine-hydrolysing)